MNERRDLKRLFEQLKVGDGGTEKWETLTVKVPAPLKQEILSWKSDSMTISEATRVLIVSGLEESSDSLKVIESIYQNAQTDAVALLQQILVTVFKAYINLDRKELQAILDMYEEG